jgi:hypothetical protein
MALYVYIIISLVMLYGGIHLLVVVITRVKDSLFKMFLGAIGVGLILGAVAVFLAGIWGV